MPSNKKKKKHGLGQAECKTSMVIRYVEGLSEAVSKVYKRCGISITMRPHITIRNLLVHPKDKVGHLNLFTGVFVTSPVSSHTNDEALLSVFRAIRDMQTY